MWIDDTNFEQFIGKTVDAKNRIFHHYPLTILRMPFGDCFRDCTGTFVINDFKKEPVYYDEVLNDCTCGKQEAALSEGRHDGD